MLLFEGGNIWDDVETNFDPLKVGKPLADTTQKFLDPLKTQLHHLCTTYVYFFS